MSDGKHWEVIYFDRDMSSDARLCDLLKQKNGLIVKTHQHEQRQWAHYVQYGDGNEALSHYYEHIIDTFLHYTSAP